MRTFSAYLTFWPQMTFDLGIWPLTAWTYQGSHIISINQVWFKLDFNFSNEAIFTFSAYLTTWPQLWPWYMTFDLINKWGFPCCIYDPTLVKIHQSMWKIEPNVNPFFTTDNNNNRQQGTKWISDPCVSFLLRQATQKMDSFDLFPFQKCIILYTSQLQLGSYSMQYFSQFLGWHPLYARLRLG